MVGVRRRGGATTGRNRSQSGTTATSSRGSQQAYWVFQLTKDWFNIVMHKNLHKINDYDVIQ